MVWVAVAVVFLFWIALALIFTTFLIPFISWVLDNTRNPLWQILAYTTTCGGTATLAVVGSIFLWVAIL